MVRRLGAVVATTTLGIWMAAADPSAQAVAGAERAKPVQGDPGISSMVVLDRPEFRILRDYAEPGATRRMHNHADATYQVFVLVTGELTLTIQGQEPVKVAQGEALYLAGGVQHTFVNTGKVAATIVEVFGKGPKPAAGHDEALAIARALAAATPAKQ